MAARTTRSTRSSSTRRRKRRRKRRSGGLPTLEQRHVDLLALALVALSVFSAFVVYWSDDGGEAGGAFVDGVSWLIGAGQWVLPIALLAAGLVLILRPVLPATRPFRSGAICLVAALMLGMTAGTLGLGPGAPPEAQQWQGEIIRPRGGIVGAGLYWACSTLVGTVGAHIVALFLALAGILLLTGASIAGVLQATSSSVATTTRRMRDTTQELRERLVVPEPDEEPRVRRAPKQEPEEEDESFWSGEERYPDLFEGDTPPPAPPAKEPEPELPEPPAEPRLAEDPETDEEGVTRSTAGPQREVEQEELTPQGRYRSSVTESPDFVWTLPNPSFLTRSSADQLRPDTAGQAEVARQLVEALGHFGVSAQVTGRVAGPHITRYELQLAPGTKVNKVANLKDDLAYALAATDIRILAPIPGKRAVGVEVPNARRKIVHLGDVMQRTPEDWSPLTVWLGKDVAGRAIGADLAKMPHLLVAGTTGAGKSGAINAMLASVLLHASPHEVRMVLVDPKQVELNHYEAIPHLLTPVITSPRKAAAALQNLVREMESRYAEMAMSRARKLTELNKIRADRDQAPLPYILCVIDELADLMMVAPADVEDSIIRLAQKARAVGIHLVLATQSPRVDVITGMIKANVPSRIAFAVSSQTDSRVILDQNGAEALLGMGDMLFAPVGSSRLQRIQGAFIDEEQIAALTEEWRKQGEPEFREDLLEEVVEEAAEESGDENGMDPDEDPLLEDAIGLVAQMQTASTSMLQRRLRLGYTRAGRLIDMLERRGVISGYEGSKPRQVLISESDVPRVIASLRERAAHPPGSPPAATAVEEPPAPLDPAPTDVGAQTGPEAPPPYE